MIKVKHEFLMIEIERLLGNKRCKITSIEEDCITFKIGRAKFVAGTDLMVGQQIMRTRIDQRGEMVTLPILEQTEMSELIQEKIVSKVMEITNGK